MSPSANGPCLHSQVMPAAPWAPSGLLVVSVWAEAFPRARSEQPLAEEPRCRHSSSLQLPKPRGAAAFQELLASSCPALPASWDTLREHQGASLAASRSHRGLWARKTAPASAATMALTWQHSPAGNAPCHSPEELGPRSKVTLRTRLVRLFLGKQRDIV